MVFWIVIGFVSICIIIENIILLFWWENTILLFRWENTIFLQQFLLFSLKWIQLQCRKQIATFKECVSIDKHHRGWFWQDKNAQWISKANRAIFLFSDNYWNFGTSCRSCPRQEGKLQWSLFTFVSWSKFFLSYSTLSENFLITWNFFKLSPTGLER